jgi:hypothetical protein
VKVFVDGKCEMGRSIRRLAVDAGVGSSNVADTRSDRKEADGQEMRCKLWQEGEKGERIG